MWVGNLIPFDRFQRKKIITIMWNGNLLPFDRFQKKKIITIMWDGNLLHFDRFQTKKNYYNYARGQFTTFWQIPEIKITIMREGKLLPIDRFQTNIIIIIMWEGKLLHFDRFPTKKKLKLCERAIYYLLTDSRQKNNYNYVRGY